MAYWSKVQAKLADHRKGFWIGHESNELSSKTLRPNSQILLADLIWPAAAGNVGWAAFTTVVDVLDPREPKLGLGEYGGRLIVLVILSIYLGSDWLRTRQASLERPRAYFIWDLIHLTAIGVYAIGVGRGLPQNSLYVLLSVVFVVTALGHVFGAWRTPAKDPPWQALAAANSSGLVVLGLTHLFSSPSHLWCALAIIVVLGLWWCVEYIFEWPVSGRPSRVIAPPDTRVHEGGERREP